MTKRNRNLESILRIFRLHAKNNEKPLSGFRQRTNLLDFHKELILSVICKIDERKLRVDTGIELGIYLKELRVRDYMASRGAVTVD